MQTSFVTFRERLNAGPDPNLKGDLEQAVVARRAERGQHREWALLCEDAGLLSLAFSELQLALRDDPQDPVAAFHLAQHYRERGDPGRAAGLLARLLEIDPARELWLSLYVEILREDNAEPRVEDALQRAVQHGLPAATADTLRRAQRRSQDEPAPETPARGQPTFTATDADCFRFHTLFSGREGVYARQWVKPSGEGGYSPIQEPLTPAVIRNHLLGTFTVGVYPIRLDSTATFFALDLDIDKTALQRAHGDPPYAQSLRDTLRQEGPRLLQVLRGLGFDPLFENSGYKGRHYWVFLEQPETAEMLHLFGRLLLAWQSPLLARGLHLEFFPKQASLKGKGLGNLIKVPLGIHRRTGHRSQLLDAQGQAVADPFAILRAATSTPRTALYAALEQLKGLAPPGGAVAPAPATPTGELEPAAPAVATPPPPTPAPFWTEADFEADPRLRHLLRHCPVLAELKHTVDEHRRLSHEEQLVLIHSVGHVEGGPQAVNYLFNKCVDIGSEKYMKDRLKGNPVSCPSIRKKIPHITRRVACNCPFEFAKDRYPHPVLHLLTLPARAPIPSSPAAQPANLTMLAQRYGLLERRRAEIQREWEQLRAALVAAMTGVPDRVIACEGGRYRLVEREGVEELVWEAE
ncbi:MAG: CRISPR-associated primase-polymerase type A1 [Planctomycetota bacterium]|nr:CRISPR-associated primase-polymerase type A1 [Planctomycetota bacterium]